jgi:hypothetical protein
MSVENDDQAPALAAWDESAETLMAYLAALTGLLAEWASEADAAAYDAL